MIDLDTKGGKCFQDKDVISWVNASDSFSLMTKKMVIGFSDMETTNDLEKNSFSGVMRQIMIGEGSIEKVKKHWRQWIIKKALFKEFCHKEKKIKRATVSKESRVKGRFLFYLFIYQSIYHHLSLYHLLSISIMSSFIFIQLPFLRVAGSKVVGWEWEL